MIHGLPMLPCTPASSAVTANYAAAASWGELAISGARPRIRECRKLLACIIGGRSEAPLPNYHPGNPRYIFPPEVSKTLYFASANAPHAMIASAATVRAAPKPLHPPFREEHQLRAAPSRCPRETRRQPVTNKSLSPTF